MDPSSEGPERLREASLVPSEDFETALPMLDHMLPRMTPRKKSAGREFLDDEEHPSRDESIHRPSIGPHLSGNVSEEDDMPMIDMDLPAMLPAPADLEPASQHIPPITDAQVSGEPGVCSSACVKRAT
jgi:hypothetical protein